MGEYMKKIIGAALLLPLLSTQISAETAAAVPSEPPRADLVVTGQGGTLRAAGYLLDAEQVRHPEQGGVILSGVTLTRPGRDGLVLIRQVEVSNLAIAARLLDPTGPCLATDAMSGTVTAREIRFRPDQDLGVPEGREEVRLPLLRLEATQIGCSLQVSAEADGVSVSGVDGSRIDLATIEARARLSGPSMHNVDLRVDLFGISLNTVEGPGGLAAAEAGFSMVADLAPGGLLDQIRSDAPLPDLISAGRDGVLRGGAYFRGLELTPDRFLPEGDLKRVRLDGKGPIRGDFDLTGSVERGELRFRIASDLSGLAAGEIALIGGLPGPSAPVIPEAISASVPIPADLIGSTLSRLSLSWRDDGVSDLMREVLGRDPEGAAQALIGERVERVAGRLPGGLSATALGAWGEIRRILRDGSGTAGLRPEQPVSLLELGVSGLMGPTLAASRAGAFTGP
jgi:hypothetical protein